jgi:soluble lytic murein transglycosylase-like protein
MTYLTGEAQLRGNHVEPARATFRELSTWAGSLPSTGPYKDGWGASGLAAVALWRWLHILDAQGGTPEEIDLALKTARALYRTRFFAGMVHGGLLPALPLVEENSARLLAHILWKAKRPEAYAVYLAFVSIDSVGRSDPTDELIARQMFDHGLATPERLDLFRYRRQLGRVMTQTRKQHATDALWRLWNSASAPADVRAEAGYEWSNFYRRSREKKKDIITVLSGTYELAGGTGLIAEKALYLRGTVQNSVAPRDPDAFFSDMTRLREQHPNSPLAADALYQIASEQLFATPPNVDRALSNLSKLRAFEGVNDWLDSAYFLAAAAFIDRGGDEDLNAADRLLAGYVERFPDGVFRRRCLFWRGRIAEKKDDIKAAEALYKQLIDEAPYDYYGLRASMHLEDGASATSMALPRANSKTWIKIRDAYRRSNPEAELARSTPYHVRLQAAESTGLYAQLLTIVDGLGRQFRNRLDNIPLQELDERNLIPAAAMLLALRQDALAARDSALTAENQLTLAGFLGRRVGDWPTALAMTVLRGDAPHRRLTELQNDARFLATVYPGVDALTALREPLARAAWQMGGSASLSESLMYAIIRRESGFYTGAISSVGALGLFQIMPANFEKTAECWKPRDVARRPTPASYLFDPARNTQFWSCWIEKEKFQPRVPEDIPLMLVKQHAGRGNLSEWMKHWQGRTIERDLELQIDAFRFPATQLFARSVLADTAIAHASGLFDTSAAATPRENP